MVEVTHSQKFSQVEVCCLERVEAILNTKKVRPSGKWWSYYFLAPLSEDMKDVFRLPRGLGLRGVIVLRFVTFYIMYNTSDLRICQPLEPIFVQDVQNVV